MDRQTPFHGASSTWGCDLSARGTAKPWRPRRRSRRRRPPEHSPPRHPLPHRARCIPKGPREPPGHGGCETFGNVILSAKACSPSPLKYCRFLLQTTFPASAFYGLCWGCPTCHLGRGLCQPLVLMIRVSVGPRQHLLLSSPALVPPFPVEVAYRQQAGLPKGAGFRGAWGGGPRDGLGADAAGAPSCTERGGSFWEGAAGPREKQGCGRPGLRVRHVCSGGRGLSEALSRADLAPWASRPCWRSVGSGVTVC